MKKFYMWDSSEKFRRLDEYPREAGDFIFNEISTSIQEVKHLWKPFPFRFEDKKKRISDFPYLNPSLFAISEQALVVLKDLIAAYVEILPLNIENSDQVFYALNVIQTYDIDVSRSECYIDTDAVRVYAFPDDVLPQAPIFRLKKIISSCLTKTYISEEFRKIVEANKLKGLLFDEEMKYRIGNNEGPSKDHAVEENKISPLPPEKIHTLRKMKSSLEFKHYPVTDIGPPITKKLLDAFEKHLPRALPDDYRDFLK